jgi:hypothetical protein
MLHFRTPASDVIMDNMGEYLEYGQDQDLDIAPENVATGTRPEECVAVTAASSSGQTVGEPVRRAKDPGIDA